MRSAALVALVAVGVFAAGCASSRGVRSVVARSTPTYVSSPRTVQAPSAVRAPVRRISEPTYSVYAPPPPSMTSARTYARAPVRAATPVRRAAPVVRQPAPAPRAAPVARRAAAVSKPSGGGLAGLLSPCGGGT